MRNVIFTIFFVLTLTVFSFGQDRIPIIDPVRFSNNLTWQAEKQWLSNAADGLKLKANTALYIIIYTKNPENYFNRQRQQRMSRFLIKNQKINKTRVQIIITKSEFEETMYWIVSEEKKKSMV